MVAQKTRKQKGRRRASRNRRATRKQQAGARYVGNLNPGIYHREYETAKELIAAMAAEQANIPRFEKFKELLQFFLDSEEVIKAQVLRNMIRLKIGEFYGLDKDYINADLVYSDLVQNILLRINHLDTKGVRHQDPN